MTSVSHPDGQAPAASPEAAARQERRQDTPAVATAYPPGMRRSWIRRIMPKTLLGRTLAIMMIPLVLLQLISTWMFYDRHWDTVTRRLSESVSNDISAVVQLIQEHPEVFNDEELVEFARRRLWLHVNYRPGDRLPDEVPKPGFSILDRKLHEAREQRKAQRQRQRRKTIVGTAHTS